MVKPQTNLGYMYGLRRDAVPNEKAGRPMFGKQQSVRLAGDLLNIELVEPGTQPEPYVTGSELRQGLRGNVPGPN